MEREKWEKGKDGRRAGCQRGQRIVVGVKCAGRGSQDEGDASLSFTSRGHTGQQV